MVGGDLRFCSGSNEDNPESSQDLLESWVVWVEIRSSARHRSGLVLNVSRQHACPLHDITNILHKTVGR